MAVIKIACPKCGQKVSGDDSFFGSSVECPICTSKIIFPPNPDAPKPLALPQDSPPEQAAQLDAADLPPTPSSEPMPSAPPEYDSRELPPREDSDIDVPQRVASHDDFQEPPKSDHSVDLPPTHSEGRSRRARGGHRGDDNAPSPALGATSLVLGILGIVTCVGMFLLSPAAMICGHLALAKAKHSPVQPAPGRTLALIGTILGYVGLVLLLLGLVLLPVIKPAFDEFIKTSQEAGAF